VAWRTGPAFVVGGLATLAGFVVVWCRGPARADSAVTDRLVRWWASVWLHAAGARVTVEGLEHIEAGTSYVVVSNHQSNLDPILCLGILPMPLRALTAGELFRVTVFGRVMRMIGMIEVNRESPDFGKIGNDASRSLAAGRSVLVYPEGRVSPDGTIGKFKTGAFAIAAANQTPVLPVAVHGTRQIWPPGRPRIRSGPVRIAVGPPLPASYLADHHVAAVRNEARGVIMSAHRALVETMSEP
jgi:1-acyl-sn-glycerol-3-phosphate acyltransferase